MQNGAAKRQTLFPAACKRGDDGVFAAGKPGHLDGERDPLRQTAVFDAVDAAEKAQIFQRGQIVIK